MKKSTLIVALIFGLCFQTFPQYNEARRKDSIRLDSIKERLLLLKDKARVNALNEIAMRWLYFTVPGNYTARVDSIRLYFSKAYEEASRIGYRTGMALALISLSGFESWMNLPITDTS